MANPTLAESGVPLIGRSGEVAVLDEAVRTNQLSVIEIVGEAGIGKTTLLEHLGAAATRAGALVLSGRCSEYERDVPYALLLEALDGHLAADGPPPGLTDSELAALGGPSRRWTPTPGRPPSATSCTAPSASSSNGSPRRAASCCCSTTCTGPTRPRSPSSPRSSGARRRHDCCSRSPTGTARPAPRWTPSCGARPTPGAPAAWRPDR